MDNKGFEKDNDKNVAGRSKQQTYTPGVEDDDDKVDLSCGLGRFRTNIFGAKFANLYMFSVILSVSAVFHMMIWQVIDVHIQSLQRQFNIKASDAALFDTAARIGLLCTCLFPGHFAKRAHIPVMIGFAGLIQGIILMVPGFLQFARPYELPDVSGGGNDSSKDSNAQYLCMPDAGSLETNSTAKEEKPVDEFTYYALLVVQLLKGLIEPFHAQSLVNIYMDDNAVDKRRLAHFIGIQAIIMDLAQPASKAINGFFTEIPVDLKPTAMSPKDQRFVGAWWLGFLCFGLASGVFSIPLILFPRRLVSKKQQAEAMKRAQKAFAGKAEDEESQIDEKKSKKNQLDVLKDEERRASISSFMDPDIISDQRKLSFGLIVNDRRPSTKSNGHLEPNGGDHEKRRLSYGGGLLYESEVEPPKEEIEISTEDNIGTDTAQDGEKKDENLFGGGGIKHLLKDFPMAIGRLFKNIVFIFIIIDIFVVSIPISGTGLFRSLYVAREFNIPMKDVQFAKAVMQTTSNVLGTLVSTYISSRVRTKLGYMKIIVCTYLMTMIFIPLYLILDCDNVPVYGHLGELGVPLNSTAEMCGCDLDNQLLSCGSDGRLYYSPCFAGCTEVDGQNFHSCSMMVGNSTNGLMNLEPGLCETPCFTNFVIYIVLHGVVGLVWTMAMVPRKLLMIRVVDPRDRGFAFGMFYFFWLLLSVPAPNLFGRVIDSSCSVNDDKVCSLYNRDTIRYIMGAVDVGVAGVVTMNYCWMLFFSTLKDRHDRRKEEKKAQKARQEKEMTRL